MKSRQELLIVVGTENKAKLAAVESVFRSLGDVAFSIIGVSAESEVSEQPMSNDETMLGASNRAANALQQYGYADLAIGLEGGVQKQSQAMFLSGWAAIIDPRRGDGKSWFGQSAAIELPESIEQGLIMGKELGPLILELYPDVDSDIRQKGGTNGLLTDGRYTRQLEFEDALKVALWRYMHDTKSTLRS